MSYACGIHPVRTALKLKRATRLYLDPTRKDGRVREIRELAVEQGIPFVDATSADLSRLVAGIRHQGVVAEVKGHRLLGESDFESWIATSHNPLVLILEGLQDPRNLGACLRAADGAGVNAVILPSRRSVKISPSVRRTASGAVEALDIYTVVNLTRTLKLLGDEGILRVGAVADGDAKLPWSEDLSGPTALVVGAEGTGLRRLTRTHLDTMVKLPMNGVVESLNVAVACGVLLYEICRQRGQSGA